jgi:hypothetical protein
MTLLFILLGLLLAPFVLIAAWGIFLLVTRILFEVAVRVGSFISWVLKTVFWS